MKKTFAILNCLLVDRFSISTLILGGITTNLLEDGKYLTALIVFMAGAVISVFMIGVRDFIQEKLERARS